MSYSINIKIETTNEIFSSLTKNENFKNISRIISDKNYIQLLHNINNQNEKERKYLIIKINDIKADLKTIKRKLIQINEMLKPYSTHQIITKIGTIKNKKIKMDIFKTDQQIYFQKNKKNEKNPKIVIPKLTNITTAYELYRKLQDIARKENLNDVYILGTKGEGISKCYYSPNSIQYDKELIKNGLFLSFNELKENNFEKKEQI